MLGSASTKQYGRSGSGPTVDSIFTKRATADPFLFDSEDSDSPSTDKVKSPGKKKPKTKSSNKINKIDVKSTQNKRGKLKCTASGGLGETGTADKHIKEDLYPKRHNTRSRSGSVSSKDGTQSNLISMQITSTTIQQGEVDSDHENTQPVMSISSETVCITAAEDSGYNGYSTTPLLPSKQTPLPSSRRTRSSSNVSTSSLESRDSVDVSLALHRQESDRLKQFLGSTTRARHSSSESNVSTRSATRRRADNARSQRVGKAGKLKTESKVSATDALTPVREESEALKQFISNKSVSDGDSDDSLYGFTSVKDDRYSTKPKTANTTSSNNGKTYKPMMSERLKQFLNSSSKSVPVTSTTSTHVHTSLDLERSESDRLKRFLQGDRSNHNSDENEARSERSLSSVTSFDLTLVANSSTNQESRRLQEFLGTLNSDVDNTKVDLVPSNNHNTSVPTRVSPIASDSSEGRVSPVDTDGQRKESRRLREFLGYSGSEAGNDEVDRRENKTRETTPDSIKGDCASRVALSSTSGLSQPVNSMALSSVAGKTGMSKRKLVGDDFMFDSDSDSIERGNVSPKLNTGNPSESKPTSSLSSKPTSSLSSKPTSSLSSKPVINFEKMEGRKERVIAKPTRKLLTSPSKMPSKYRYNHRAWLDETVEEEMEAVPSSSAHSSSHTLRRPLQLKKVVKYPDRVGERISTQVKVRSEQKKLYTVVRNVRQAHECQDHGETQQIDDDLEFLLDGLKPVGATSSRYLSAISLANKCTNPTFRMHLRSNTGLAHIFTSLSDAPTDARLALSATAIMFMLCQDRLNMDLDRASLQLMVELLEYDDRAHLDNRQEILDYNKSIDTVYDLYKSAIPHGEEQIDKVELSPGYLAMECLLVLTSRRSGDWFKEELREVGALVCIADSVIDKTVVIMRVDYDMELSAHVLMLMKKVCRGMRVLEHVTAYNTGNQNLIIQHKGGEFVVSLCRLLMFGVEAIATHCIDTGSLANSPGYLLLQLMLGVLRVLVNVTHNSESGCGVVSSFYGIVDVLLKSILQCPQYILEEQRFDLLVLGIGLSINMCEHSPVCRQTLLDSETLSSYDSICEQESVTSVQALLMLFYQRLRAAERIESETGNLQDSDIARAVSDDLSESLTEVLHKAGRHMEDTIVASYIALLIGVIVQHSPDYMDQIKQFLEDGSFSQIISVLQKFLNFMKMADAASGNTGSKSIASVIRYLREYTS